MKNILILLLLSSFIFLSAQESLLGPKDRLAAISELYSKNVKDFTVKMTWTQEDKVQKATVFFKNPQKIKMEFDEPKGQVIVSNGYDFFVYIEHMNIVLQQDLMVKEKVKDKDGNSTTVVPEILINPVGFDRFLKEYAVEFHEQKTTIDYIDGAKVYTFKLLRWRSSQHGFNAIYLTVQPDGLIRKVEGITAAYKRVVLEFDSYVINTGLPDLKFEFEKPAHANTVKNFISKQGDE